MSKNTGMSLHLYTTKEELQNASNGVSTIVGWTKEQKPEGANYHISASTMICDVLEKEVRINVSRASEEFDKIGSMMGITMAAELEKAFKNLV
jgi:hypothetical protein